MRNHVREVRYLPGHIAVRLWGMPAGEWLHYASGAASLRAHVEREIGPFPNLHRFCAATGLPQSYFNEVDEDRLDVPPLWFLRLHDLTGIPVAELRLVAGAAPLADRHPAARKERKPHLMPAPPKPFGYFSAS